MLAMIVAMQSIVEANVHVYTPEDMPNVNLTSLNYDMFDVVESMSNIKQLSDKINLQDYIRKLFLLIWRFPIVDISTLHHYDSHEDKLISGGPKVNRTDCNIKLNHLVEKVAQEQANGLSLVDKSIEYRLFNVLDSFGRPASSFLQGNVIWLGDYDQCLSAEYYHRDNNIDTPITFNSRYCLAHLRWPHWKHTEGFKEWIYTTVRSAVCLPESCDSLTAELEENKQLISMLMEVNFGSAYKNFKIGDIFCLPDKQSPLTQWWSETPSTICVLFFTIWLTLIMTATLRDLFGCPSTTFDNIFSLVINTKKLFDVSKRDSLEEQLNVKKKEPFVPLELTNFHQNNNSKNSNNNNNIVTNGEVGQPNRSRLPADDVIVDMNYLHCVKVIMLFIIMKAHFFLFTTTAYKMFDLNVSFNLFDLYHLSFAGMAVNIFFMITGTLVAYTLFQAFPPFTDRSKNKSNLTTLVPLVVITGSNTGDNNIAPTETVETQQIEQQQQTTTTTTGLVDEKLNLSEVEQTSRENNYRHPLLQPGVWIGFCLNRYIRLIPLWATLTLTVKYLYKFLGDGPLWDYGTSANTNLGQCEQESLFLLFLGLMNVRPVYQNCVASSWYVMIDLQCAIIVAPIVIMAYVK